MISGNTAPAPTCSHWFAAAAARRHALGLGHDIHLPGSPSLAVRLVFSEADGVPGLVAEVYRGRGYKVGEPVRAGTQGGSVLLIDAVPFAQVKLLLLDVLLHLGQHAL
jgi:hypothetical protein